MQAGITSAYLAPGASPGISFTRQDTISPTVLCLRYPHYLFGSKAPAVQVHVEALSHGSMRVTEWGHPQQLLTSVVRTSIVTLRLAGTPKQTAIKTAASIFIALKPPSLVPPSNRRYTRRNITSSAMPVPTLYELVRQRLIKVSLLIRTACDITTDTVP